MKNLTDLEKKNHSEELKKFVNKLNYYILNSNNLPDGSKSFFKSNEIKLLQVGYGILVNSHFFYFDYPFEKTVNEFNKDLANHPELKGKDVFIHEKFQQFQGENDKGFIFYEYSLNIEEKYYNLYNTINNIGIEKDDDIISRFLPIMDCAITNVNTYLFNVSKTKSIKPNKQIIILSKKIGLANNYSYDNNTLVCAFSLNLANSKINKDILSNIAKNLYSEVFFLLENYFHSPVLTKLIQEHRKSYILGYKHSISQLYINTYVNNLSSYIKNKNEDKISATLEALKIRINCLDLFHDFMFDYEMANAGITKVTNNKSVTDLLNNFIENINFYNIKPTINKIGDNLSDYRPIIDVENSNYELFDIHLILFNLWDNASAVVSEIEDYIFEIELSYDNNGNYSISFKNSGLIDCSYIKYLEFKGPYPKVYDETNPYQGLQIIRDLVKSNKKLELTVYPNEIKNTTEIVIIIKK